MAAGHSVILVLINIGLLTFDNTNAGIDCSGVPECDKDLCQRSICPKHSDASCKLILDACGNCRAEFVNNDGDELDDCFDLSVGPCLPEPCKPDPCTIASCPFQPGAICYSDTCIGCRAEFRLNGDVLTQSQCMLGSGPVISGCPSPVPCNSDPCIGANCPALSAAQCRANYCDCKAEFFIGDRKIEEHFCVGLEPCPLDVPQAACHNPPGETCMGQKCPLFPDAKCIIDGCGGCKVIFFNGRQRLSEEDCNGCPPFSPRDCDPCEGAVCADHSDARCEPRRCGMCKAIFYGADRKEIKSCCKNEFCEDGSTIFHCKKNPCDDAVCLAYPTSTCEPNYCGGCKAEFTTSSGRKLSDAECVPIEFCPNDIPIAACSGGPCLGQTCPMYPGAECVIDPCSECTVIFYYGGKRLTDEDCNGCPGDNKVAGCIDPCVGAVCEGHPRARCEPQVCGQCKAKFFGRDRKEVTCGAPSHSSFCSDGQTRFDCAANPCDIIDCTGAPTAECRPNYCDGCKAEFFNGNARIPEYRCMVQEICPGDVPVAGCMGPPGQACLGATCPNYPDAECYIDGCGGCNVVFYIGRKRLTEEDCQGCPDDAPRVFCVDPCKNALCPLYPEARCEPRVCGQCSAVFYGLDRQQIMDCCGEGSIPTTPPDIILPPITPCSDPSSGPECEDICGDMECPAIPRAECRMDYCECKANFYIDDTMIELIDCVEFEPCPDHQFTAKCSTTPKCLGQTCPRYPDAQCRLDGCGGCKAIFYDGMRRLTAEDCEGCRSPFPPRQCDACKKAQCPEISDARCEERKCGTCKAVFYGADRNEIDSCCQDGEKCPDGTLRFHCHKNPCDDADCPARKRATCRPNYCGGCKAEFYIGGRKLSETDCIAIDPCPPKIAVARCTGRPCICPNYPDAKCKTDSCGGCRLIYYSKRKRLTMEDCFGCPRDDKVDGCVNPCDGAICKKDPTARCEPRTCGECLPIFYGKDRQKIDCGVEPDECPDGMQRFTCAQDPCSVKSCPGVPSSTCRSEYCGGCFAIFFYKDGERIPERECPEKESCPGDLPVAKCIDSCRTSSCPLYPDADCRVDGCAGACKAIFYDGRRRLTDEECNGCPSGQTIAKDCDDPCKNALCPLYPDARCEPRRCGICRVAFFGADRREIMSCCGVPSTAPPPPSCQCDPKPCDGISCPNYPSAICIPNCDACTAEFLEDDMMLTLEQCGTVGPSCPGNKVYQKCASPCQDTCTKRHKLCNAGPCISGCYCPFGTVMLEEGSDACVAPEDCPKPKCPGDKIYTKCAAMCLDSCETKHKKCPRGCDRNNNCVCPKGTIMLADGSDKCVKENRCPKPKCPGNKIYTKCAAMCLDSCETKHNKCPRGCDRNNHCVCPKGTIMLADGSDKCVRENRCPKPKCPGDKIYTKCAPMCLDSCETKHKRCPLGCDTNNNCVCPPGTVMMSDGSNKCIKEEKCPKRPGVICPPNVPIALCKANPCDVASCPAQEQAKCKANYCGGCHADFFLNGRKLTDLECVKNPDECSLFTTCSIDVCFCPARPLSTCVVQHCEPNTCKPLYFDQYGKKLSNEECGLCPDGTATMNCGILPLCLVALCPAFPKAKCRSTNCGMCKTWFEDADGNTVDCRIKTKVQCKVPPDPPHGNVAPNNRASINLGESVIYQCDIGFDMRGSKSRKCVERRGTGRLTGVSAHCFDERCPEQYSSDICRNDCRSNHECGYNKMCCRSGCSQRCFDIPDLCPDGDPPVQCYADPCAFQKCPRYPTAKCKPNYCGGCNADWYFHTTKLLPFDCAQPEDLRCPSLNLAIPICIDLCTSDKSCDPLKACCFNGCGHQCYGY